MKTTKFFALIILVLVIAGPLTGQTKTEGQATTTATKGKTITMDKDGTFVLQSTKTVHQDSLTGKKYQHSDGKIYFIYKGARDGLYIWRTSKKSGKKYKSYPKFTPEQKKLILK